MASSSSQLLLLQHFAPAQNPNQCFPPIAKLGFVSCVPPSSKLVGSRHTSVSISWSRGAQPRKPGFVVRAESEPQDAAETVSEEQDAAAASDNAQQQEEAAEEAEQVEEPKPARKPRVKLGDIMGILHKRAIEASEKERPTPDIRTGDIVEIKLEVPENKRRLSIYKGIVISKQNSGIHTTIRIRRIIAGVGVEIVFPVYSPNIKEIKVVSHRKVRRARLYYLRDKLPRLSTFK